MLSVFRTVLLASLVAAFTVFLAGCAEHGKTKEKSSAMSGTDDTIVVATNGGQMTVFTGGRHGEPIMAYSTGTKTCTQCEMDVKNYFMTGKLDPVCKECGATRKVVTGNKVSLPH